MAQNFVACDRDQELLLPPSLRDWLPQEHLAWFVIDAVAAFDLTAFYAAYRVDGHGRPAHDPAMMVALLLYGYAIGERSSRRLERRCVEDVATRVICAKQAPDHTTIARFRQRHETALAELFGEVLALCAESGLVRVGVIAVDGTKIAANAALQALVTRAGMSCRRRCPRPTVGAAGCVTPSAASTTSARRRRDRFHATGPIGSRRPSVASKKQQVECRADAAYEAYRARGVDKNGKKFGRPPKPFAPSPTPEGKINLSDLDSRNVKRRAAGCRATTRKLSAPKTRSSSPPR